MEIHILQATNTARQVGQTIGSDIAMEALSRAHYMPAIGGSLAHKYALSTEGEKGLFNKIVVGNVRLVKEARFNEQKKIIDLHDVRLSVSRQHTIVQTALQGRQGTIKEFITAQDYDIQLAGSIYTDIQNQYPVEDVQKLIELLSTAVPIQIHAQFLSLFESIKNVVVQQFDIKQNPKYMNRQEFTCSLLSDQEVSLELSLNDV